MMRQALWFDAASWMQAAVAVFKPDAVGRVVVEVVAGRTVVDVVVGRSVGEVVARARVVEVVVGGSVEDVVVGARVVDVLVVVTVVVVGSARLAQLVRQALKAVRQTATLVGCAQALRHAPKAATVAAAHAGSPWHRAPAIVQLF